MKGKTKQGADQVERPEVERYFRDALPKPGRRRGPLNKGRSAAAHEGHSQNTLKKENRDASVTVTDRTVFLTKEAWKRLN